MEACVIARHLHCSCGALTDIDDVDTPVGGFFQDIEQPWALWGVATAIRPHHDTFDLRYVEHLRHDMILYAGEEGEHHDIRICGIVRNHRLTEIGLQDMLLVIDDIDSRIRQMGVVETVEGIEAIGIYLC